jgi:hypothetical protein
MKEGRARNIELWNTYLDHFCALQSKDIDQVSADDRTMFHNYVYYLIGNNWLSIFTTECPHWSYIINLVDSTIMKKDINQQLSALESRMSTHPHTNSMAAGHNPGHNTHHNDAHILLQQLRNM